MTLPMKANTTCDIFGNNGGPGGSPRVAGVACYLKPTYYQGLEHGEGDATNLHYDHILWVDVSVDIRDFYNLGLGGSTSQQDAVYIPDHTGTKFLVVFVERRNRGTAFDHKRAYLVRQTPAWPTTNL
jgi:hypothetical protein